MRPSAWPTWIVMILLISSLNATAQINSASIVEAKVYPDSSKPAVTVKNLHLEFIFAGYGVYLPSDYPTVTYFPLETGERIAMENIAEMQCFPVRVEWKKYLEPEQRARNVPVDAQGYRHWSDVEVDVLIKDWNGNQVKSRLLTPDISDVFLTGRTDRGDFRLQLDQENGKLVRLEFEPLFIMQCSGDINHLFPNMKWKYCPLCGASLKKVTKKKGM
ncbi:MAG TPA: hypothetical protein PKI81_05915 [bacterium]|nr:hypothetical protein [bacterium]HOC88131.1 hypothetical protein [bacterium]